MLRVGAQGADADAEQEGEQVRIVGHLPADADFLAGPPGGVGKAFERPEDGGVFRPVGIGHLFVHPVHTEKVLDEIIRADREKIGFAGKLLSDFHDGGHLDHGPEGRGCMMGKPLPLKDMQALHDQFPGAGEFIQRRDHRKHDPQTWGIGAGTQDRAHLLAELFRVAQREADGTQPELGVGLTGDLPVGGHLVTPDIQGPEDHPPAGHGVAQKLVDAVLLFLRRKICPDEERKLGPIKTDALGLEFPGDGHLAQEVDIGHQAHPHAVAGMRLREHHPGLQCRGPARPVVFPEALDDVPVRIDVHIAQFGVHEYGRVLRNGKQAGAAGDDERNAGTDDDFGRLDF